MNDDECLAGQYLCVLSLNYLANVYDYLTGSVQVIVHLHFLMIGSVRSDKCKALIAVE